MEQELRKKAINRHLKGESPKSIYSDLKRSKEWFFKWLSLLNTTLLLKSFNYFSGSAMS